MVTTRANFLRLAGAASIAGFSTAVLGTGRASAARQSKPNILLVYPDDMSDGMVKWMRVLRQKVKAKGLAFDRAYGSSVCATARAEILTGKQCHNNKVWDNPNAGVEMKQSGIDRDTIATRMKALGYRTGLFGKYQNESPRQYVPPGWDRFVMLTEPHNRDPYPVCFDGKTRWIDRRNNETDFVAELAESFIRSNRSVPWLCCFWPHSPHLPSIPSRRNDGWAANHGVRVENKPSRLEAGRSDKLSWLRKASAPGKDNLNKILRGMVDELQDVDDGLDRLIGALADTGQLENTYVIFLADNGYMFGEHGVEGKNTPYEEAVSTPLIVRGPGGVVPAGVTTEHLAHQIDILPTMIELGGGGDSWGDLDGRSLVPLLGGSVPETWRKRIFVESFYRDPYWCAVREPGLGYVRDQNREAMVFDRASDPYEMKSFHGTADPDLLARLEDQAKRYMGTKAEPGPSGPALRAIEEE